jgi:hypothetical protein
LVWYSIFYRGTGMLYKRLFDGRKRARGARLARMDVSPRLEAVGRVQMRRVFLIAAFLVLAGSTATFARGGMHGHSGGMHRHFGGGHSGGGALSAAANPSVPPSLTSDPRLTGSAPLPPHHQLARADQPAVTLKPDPEDVKVDHMIKSICRGC